MARRKKTARNLIDENEDTLNDLIRNNNTEAGMIAIYINYKYIEILNMTHIYSDSPNIYDKFLLNIRSGVSIIEHIKNLMRFVKLYPNYNEDLYDAVLSILGGGVPEIYGKYYIAFRGLLLLCLSPSYRYDQIIEILRKEGATPNEIIMAAKLIGSHLGLERLIKDGLKLPKSVLDNIAFALSGYDNNILMIQDTPIVNPTKFITGILEIDSRILLFSGSLTKIVSLYYDSEYVRNILKNKIIFEELKEIYRLSYIKTLKELLLLGRELEKTEKIYKLYRKQKVEDFQIGHRIIFESRNYVVIDYKNNSITFKEVDMLGNIVEETEHIAILTHNRDTRKVDWFWYIEDRKYIFDKPDDIIEKGILIYKHGPKIDSLDSIFLKVPLIQFNDKKIELKIGMYIRAPYDSQKSYNASIHKIIDIFQVGNSKKFKTEYFKDVLTMTNIRKITEIINIPVNRYIWSLLYDEGEYIKVIEIL